MLTVLQLLHLPTDLRLANIMNSEESREVRRYEPGSRDNAHLKYVCLRLVNGKVARDAHLLLGEVAFDEVVVVNDFMLFILLTRKEVTEKSFNHL